jgi:adenylate cyclase
VRVKGKDKPVAIFEPVGHSHAVEGATLHELAVYHQTLAEYRRQAWETAYAQFSQLHQQYPKRMLYKIYIERVEYFMKNPPDANWDGVYTFTTK